MANRTRPTAPSTSSSTSTAARRFGGFSDVSGLGTEITVAEYRNGNDKENHVRKVPGVHKVGDVTLKRGIVDSKTLFDWIDETRTNGPAAQKTRRRSRCSTRRGKPVQTWVLRGVIPMKYTGPDARRPRAAATSRWRSSCCPPRGSTSGTSARIAEARSAGGDGDGARALRPVVRDVLACRAE